MNYHRVIPRDLFNEAKLLKCLGQLALLIHDGVNAPRALTLEMPEPENGFQVSQDQSSGALVCWSVECACAGRPVTLSTPYNCRDAYPLRFEADGDEGRVFDESGALSEDFRATLDRLQKEVRHASA